MAVFPVSLVLNNCKQADELTLSLDSLCGLSGVSGVLKIVFCHHFFAFWNMYTRGFCLFASHLRLPQHVRQLVHILVFLL